jgi:2-aminoadipate transaminase
MEGLQPSAVREILKVAERPDIISFAGGLPAPELFPMAEISAAYERVLRDHGGRALQYGITEGLVSLREWIVARLARRQVRSSVDQLLITSGSQQGIDLIGRVLLNPGDVVVTENPTYLAALQAFAAYEVKVVAVGSDDDGMKVDALEEVISDHAPKLIYICPDFQNPKGTTLSVERRKKLVQLAQQHRIPILEDDPYGELRFRGTTPPAIAGLDEEGWVLQCGTFSKTLAPGLRLGWIHGPKELIRKLAIAKQAADLHTATLAQWAAADVLANFDFDAHLDRIRAVYGARRDVMVNALRSSMPAGVRFTEPEGGLFLWLDLPRGLRDDEVFKAGIARKVAVVPGSGFFVGAPIHGHLRLNYSNQKAEAIVHGVAELGSAMDELCAAQTGVEVTA